MLGQLKSTLPPVLAVVYLFHFPPSMDDMASDSHLTHTQDSRDKYWTPDLVRAMLQYYRLDYHRLRLPVPDWTLPLVGCRFVRALQLDASGCRAEAGSSG